jgi:hypothetical protein
MIDKLTPRILQTSKDNRAMKPTEMLDALNITVTGDEDGGAGVLKNIKGTIGVSLAPGSVGFPEGENLVIGSTKDETLGVVYFFVWNENNNHSVFAYSSITNTYRIILQTSELNFDRNGFVKGDIVRVKTTPKEEAVVVVGLGQVNPGADDENVVDIGGLDGPPVVPAFFNFCEYISETDLENGQLVQIAPFIAPITELLLANPNSVYTDEDTGNIIFYVSDILGNVYDFPLTADGSLNSASYVTGENPAFGLSLPIETFGCSYTPPPPIDVPDIDDSTTDEIDEGQGLPEVNESESAESLFLDEGVSINLADSSLDFNEDGSVNSADLLTFLQNYGITGDNILGDFDQDGSVTNADLLIFLAGYGLNVEDSD